MQSNCIPLLRSIHILNLERPKENTQGFLGHDCGKLEGDCSLTVLMLRNALYLVIYKALCQRRRDFLVYVCKRPVIDIMCFKFVFWLIQAECMGG